MKNFKWLVKFSLCLLALAIVRAKFIFAESAQRSNENRVVRLNSDPNEFGIVSVTDKNVYREIKYYRKNPFGIIGGFYLVGFNSVKTDVYTNRNVLTKLLNYGFNFGTNSLKEISYVEQLIYGNIVTRL